jgi:hypothetical protein
MQPIEECDMYECNILEEIQKAFVEDHMSQVRENFLN